MTHEGAIDLRAIAARLFCKPEWRDRVATKARNRARNIARRHRMLPRTRGECVDGPRPCPWVSCRHHLLLDVHEDSGGIRLNLERLEAASRDAYRRTFPTKYGKIRFMKWENVALQRLEELPDTCSLDVATRGSHTLLEVGIKMSMTREGARLIEVSALEKMRSKGL